MTKYNLSYEDFDSEYNDNEKDIYDDFCTPDEELENLREELTTENTSKSFFSMEDMNFILGELYNIFNIHFRIEFDLLTNDYKITGYFKTDNSTNTHIPCSCNFSYYDGDEFNLDKVVGYIARKILEEKLKDVMVY